MKPTTDNPERPPEAREFMVDWPLKGGLSQQVRAEVETHLRKRRKRRRAGGLGAALLAVGFFSYFWAVPYVRDTKRVTTPAATRRTLELADGSEADLNARTRFHADFRHGRRLVQLAQGEAYFSVVKDPAHPFVVDTPAGRVLVTGTKFDVRVLSDGRAEVTLLEGSVIFGQGARRTGLTPGEQITSGGLAPRHLSHRQLEDALAWRDGQMALDGFTLAEVAARLAAYHGISIRVAPEVQGLTPGGTFPLDGLDRFFSGLETVLPIQIQKVSEGRYDIVPRPAATR